MPTRRRVLRLIALTGSAAFAPALVFAQPKPAQALGDFVAKLWPDAHAKGITRATFDLAMRGVTPDRRVIVATQRQPEYGKPVGDYINMIVSNGRIARGKAKTAEWARTFDTVEKQYGVSRWILTAVWGMETDFGNVGDKWDVFRSLSTLAFIGYRHPFFRNELIAAMHVMQDHKIAREKMVSSWAGAMGQPQFMPSNVIAYAVDLSGDGKPDIWTNIPDVLASTANYLSKFRWRAGLPWGFEVTVPAGFDFMRSRATFAEWTALGVHRADGKPYPDGSGILFFPSGARGPAFIVTENFDVLKAYNNSDAYALAVGHLTDRMQGGAPIVGRWPADDRPLPRQARIALQKKLAALGYKVTEFEGHIDFDLRDNIRVEQKKFGMIPDGTPTAVLLEKLRVKAR